MIGYLEGTIKETYKDKIIVQTGGVGFLVAITQNDHLVGEEAKLFVHTAVRENEISLWGFKTLTELQLFEMLLGVSGVGLKTAQSVLVNIGVVRLVDAIINEDPNALRLPGVGVKTSERIILDLKGKISPGQFSDAGGDLKQSDKSVKGTMAEEAISAMLNLGYKRNEVEMVLKRLSPDSYSNTSELVRAILINM